jgi:pilus assembly protein CpaE
MADEKDQQIRVLIVDDIAETRENIRKLLQFETDVEVVGAARTGKEGIEIAVETKPDVVLMDINMPDIDGIVATENIRSKLPFTQIVILSVQSDSNYMRRAMLAGARDFLTKPPDIDDLTAAVRRAAKMAFAEKAKATPAALTQGSNRGTRIGIPSVLFGSIITIYSPKGGAGTTTLTTNLGVALHNEDTPVAVVDGNLQFGDLSFFFCEQSKNNIVDLARRGEELDREIIEDVMIDHTDSGIHILAAPSRPEQAESVTGEQFSDVLKYLRQMYSYVLVDTSSTLDDIALAALDVSDLIIVITTQDIPSIKNVSLFLGVAEALGIGRDKILLVMNRYDKRRNITPEKVSDNFKQEFAAVLPIEERIVIPAMDRGIPFMIQHRTHPIARGILKLAEGTRNKVAQLQEKQAEPIS